MLRISKRQAFHIAEKVVCVDTNCFGRVARLRDEICETRINDPTPFIAALRQTRAADLLIFREQLPNTNVQFPFYYEWDNLALLRISTFEHWWARQIHNDARRMVRKADRCGVDVRSIPFDDNLVAGIKRIWDESPLRQGRPYRHYKKDFDTVRRENATFLERAEFFGAFYSGEIIGFNKVFYTDGRADHIEIISKIAHRDKAPTNALLAASVRAAARRGIRLMTYAKYTYGKKGRDSLTDFKERNGFRPVMVPRYFVPLTRRGTALINLGLHHGLKEALPSPVLRLCSGVRIKWWRLYVRGQRMLHPRPAVMASGDGGTQI